MTGTDEPFEAVIAGRPTFMQAAPYTIEGKTLVFVLLLSVESVLGEVNRAAAAANASLSPSPK